MKYVLRFIGGPFDGGSETCVYGVKYKTIVGKQLVESGLINMAVYDYLESRESDGTTERIYQFRRTYGLDEARAEIGKSRSL